MARPPFDNAPREIVDLSSDSEDELPPRDGLEYFDARSQRQDIADAMARMDGLHEEVNAQYDPDNEAPDNIIDLTTIPDIDMPPSDRLSNEREAAEPGDFGGNTPIITEAECLQMILNVLPDIAVNHVLGLIREGTTDLARTAEQCEAIITQLLDGEAYPKEADVAKNHKRKREDDEVWKEYEKAERDPTVGSYESDA
jgi:TRIAD3 protein (E3 ubiquitin-protein ligase RNF216)